jgi:hypothetical protein
MWSATIVKNKVFDGVEFEVMQWKCVIVCGSKQNFKINLAFLWLEINVYILTSLVMDLKNKNLLNGCAMRLL